MYNKHRRGNPKKWAHNPAKRIKPTSRHQENQRIKHRQAPEFDTGLIDIQLNFIYLLVISVNFLSFIILVLEWIFLNMILISIL